MIDYIPQTILTTENMPTKSVVTSEHWNEILNLLVSQGNNSAIAVYNLIAAIEASTGAADIGAATITGVTGTTVQTIMAGLKGLLDLCYTASATDTLLAQKETVADANQLVKSITFNSVDGKFTITKQDGTTSAIDTALEKVAVNFAYDQNTQSLILTLADGSTTTIPLSALIQENDFVDSDTVDFSINNHTVTATIKNASITEAMLTSATLTALVSYKTAAETSATNAAASEANALTYKNSAATSATEALASKNAAKTSETNSKTSETNSKTSETNAKTSETNAATSATQALEYKRQASEIVGDKVISFNGRKDVVLPADADYVDSQIVLCPATQTALELGPDVRLSDVLINLVDSVDAKASFKSGSGTFLSGGTTCVVVDAFITANTQIIISPTQTKLGTWSVSSVAGSFTITSDATETGAVTFDWGATK